MTTEQNESLVFEPSAIDHDQECYYSKIMESKYQTQNHKIGECCYFRAYVSADELESTKFVLKV